jgi:predicted S18 family serine protease
MNEDLFQIPPTAPSALQIARARLAKAEAVIERRRAENGKSYEANALFNDAKRELASAEKSVKIEEQKSIEALKNQTK